MSDEHSDPNSSQAIHSSPVESIPPPDEPKTPAWLTLVGLAVVLVVLGWLAIDYASTNPRSASDGSAPTAPSGGR